MSTNSTRKTSNTSFISKQVSKQTMFTDKVCLTVYKYYLSIQTTQIDAKH